MYEISYYCDFLTKHRLKLVNKNSYHATKIVYIPSKYSYPNYILERYSDIRFLDEKKYHIKDLLDNIKKTEGLIFICFDFSKMYEIFAKILETNGYSKYGKKDGNPKFIIYPGRDVDRILRIFNNSENKYGKNIKILMTTRGQCQGFDLHNVRSVYLIQSRRWDDLTTKQVVGRALRSKSHIDLAENERNVEVFNINSQILYNIMNK